MDLHRAYPPSPYARAQALFGIDVYAEDAAAKKAYERQMRLLRISETCERGLWRFIAFVFVLGLGAAVYAVLIGGAIWISGGPQ